MKTRAAPGKDIRGPFAEPDMFAKKQAVVSGPYI